MLYTRGMANGGFFGGDPERDTHLGSGDKRNPGEIWTTPPEEQELIRKHANRTAKARRKGGLWREVTELPKKILRRLRRN